MRDAELGYPVNIQTAIIDLLNDKLQYKLGIEADYYAGELFSYDSLMLLANRVASYPVALVGVAQIEQNEEESADLFHTYDEIYFSIFVCSSPSRSIIEGHRHAIRNAQLVRAALLGEKIKPAGSAEMYLTVGRISEQTSHPEIVAYAVDVVTGGIHDNREDYIWLNNGDSN